MQSVNNSPLRNGNFTSSEIVALTNTKVAKFKTYIAECNMERKLGLSLESESNAKPLAWGKFIENRVFDLLGIEYTMTSQETIVHPEYDYWSGSPDGKKEVSPRVVFDIKCPMTRKSFCQLVDPIYNGLTGINAINEVRKIHSDGDKFYWQLVSNAILTGCDYAELIVYMPYRSELSEIREMASNYDGDQNKIAFINWASDNELPFILDGGYYKNLNVIQFEVPASDKKFLTDCVKSAGILLHKRKQELTPLTSNKD